MKRLGQDSIRQMELMRFYLQLKQDPHGPNLALFVGNLPPNLSQRNYENLLTDFLGLGELKISKTHILHCTFRIVELLLFFIAFQRINFLQLVPYTTSMARWLLYTKILKKLSDPCTSSGIPVTKINTFW